MSLYLNDLAIRKTDGESLFRRFILTLESGQILQRWDRAVAVNHLIGRHRRPFEWRVFVFWKCCFEWHSTGRSTQPHQRKVGILFQDDLLFPHLKVWENLAFSLPNSVKGSARQQQAMAALKDIELTHSKSFPDQISEVANERESV